MTKKGQDRHSMHVRELEKNVGEQYSIVQTEVPVTDPKTGNLVGDIDLVGLVDGMIDLYEVKVSHHPVKARNQLRVMRDHLQQQGYGCPMNLFYYCGSTGTLKKVG